MPSDVAGKRLPWYRTLGREQWRVLVASNLGWLFDGFEIYALFLTVGFALHQLLVPTQYQAIPRYVGYVLATTVFGWATGGVLGGIIADYIGRKRTMMLAILAYSLTTALSAAAWNWQSFAILRFLVGIGIGSEWVTGASIVSEIWPDHQYREWGRRQELPHFSTHVTSKTALIRYSECLAVEVKYYSIDDPRDGAAHRAHRHGGIFAELARRENLAALASSDLRRGPRFAHGAAARVDVGPRVRRSRRAFWVLHPAAKRSW